VACLLQAHLVLEIDTPSRLILYWKRLPLATSNPAVYSLKPIRWQSPNWLALGEHLDKDKDLQT
ncbi:MAG: hypothetical protein COX14_04150, partial [Chloroflexi bacterium CG23_combo_of_CG06-09_8_20_14_all_45_10]